MGISYGFLYLTGFAKHPCQLCDRDPRYGADLDHREFFGSHSSANDAGPYR